MPFACSPEEALRLAQLFLKGQLVVLQQLVSYADVNWLVEQCTTLEGAPDHHHQHAAKRFLLKIHNAQDSAQPEVFEAQNAAMQHLLAEGIPTSTPVASLQGPSVVMESVQGSRQPHAVRMQTFLPGQLMGQQPQSAALQRSWGAFMGRVAQALTAFDHPALRAQHDWSMMAAADTIQQRVPLIRAKALTDDQRHRLLAAAEALRVATASGGLPCQVCHADANEGNLLVDAGRTQVTAILDFGDMCYCWRAAEVAVAMTYAALLEQLPGTTEMEAAARVLAGFQKHCPLTSAELGALPALVRGRLALSLTNGLHSAQQHPHNSSYLLQTQRPGWRLLSLLEAHSDEQLTQLWTAEGS